MKVVVIGGGAAGLMAAGTAGMYGHDVLVIERNEKIGKKLYITGKGRCNITNDCDINEFLSNIVSNPKFMMSALHNFTPQDTVEFAEKYGCRTKVERGDRVFPASDKSSDFIRALDRYCADGAVKIMYDSRVEKLIKIAGKIVGVQLEGGGIIDCDAVIVATGGMSYPATGSTGDGYSLARDMGHTIVEPRPALVGIDTIEDVSALAGVSLKNVRASIVQGGKVIADDFGEMLFTHHGVSGPIILSLSSKINRLPVKELKVSIDLKASLDEATLDNRIISDMDAYANKEFRNSLGDLLISALRQPIIDRCGISPYKKVNQITKEERLRLLAAIKNFDFDIKCLQGVAAAIVTAGGVNVKEISPKDMSSKLVEGLYFVGEVLDIDALTGGFNIQIALSTGYLAGMSL